MILVALPGAPSSDGGGRQGLPDAIAGHLLGEQQPASIPSKVLAAPSGAEMARRLAAALGLTGFDTPDGFDAGSTEADGAQAAERAWEAVEALKAEGPPDATFLLLLPSRTVRSLVCRALSIPPEAGQRFELADGSLTTLEFRFQPQQRTILGLLNETCHLEAAATA